MMKFFEEKKGIEKESSVLHIWENEESKPENSHTIKNPHLEPEIPRGNGNYDVCPVCRIRAKKKEDKTCEICIKRRRGRIKQWFNDTDVNETIWMDEVADENNRVALISLEFEIGKWMDGKWLQSLWAQTLQNWIDNLEIKEDPKNNEFSFLKRVLKIESIAELNDVPKVLKLLKVIAENPQNFEQRKNIFLTFFNEKPNEDLNKLISDIKNRSTIYDEIQYKLFNYFFNKHPSPARLRRIWTETQEFIEGVQKQIHESIKQHKRITIEVESKPDEWKKLETGKLVELEDLIPDNLPVAYMGDNKFISIVNFDGYKSGENSRGLKAVKKFLKKCKDEKISLKVKKDDSEKEIDITITDTKIDEKQKPYIPTITLTKSPYQFQMLVPATSVPQILETVTSLYDRWFSKVQGKLPLKLGVLVANRKFPLYVLLDSSPRMLKGHKGFKKTIPMEPYWDVNGSRLDPYYGFYPTDKDISPEKLAPIKNNRKFYMNPGYFDFDFLGGTVDRGRIFSVVRKVII